MEEIYKLLTKEASEYYVGRIILPNDRLLFWDKENHVAKDLGFMNNIIVKNMLEVATKSGYGDMGTKTTKYDDSVRKALEIPVENIDNKLTFDAAKIKLFHQDSVRIEPYKFTIYQEGGFLVNTQIHALDLNYWVL